MYKILFVLLVLAALILLIWAVLSKDLAGKVLEEMKEEKKEFDYLDSEVDLNVKIGRLERQLADRDRFIEDLKEVIKMYKKLLSIMRGK